jgi:hypothetical protein
MCGERPPSLSFLDDALARVTKSKIDQGGSETPPYLRLRDWRIDSRGKSV